MRIGLIADTHGYLGDDVIAVLRGCDQILHAGDSGPGVLDPLSLIAPVIAVRGNNDLAGAEAALPETAFFEHRGQRIAVVHRLVGAPRDGYDILVFGHCHRQHDYVTDGRRHVNPGAAGRRGFHASRSIAIVEVSGGSLNVEFVDLGRRRPQADAPSETMVTR
jgi:putative phosphoesterase